MSLGALWREVQARPGAASHVDGAGVPGKTTRVEQAQQAQPAAASVGTGTTGLPYLALGASSTATTSAAAPADQIAPPIGGVNQPGFIDTSDGANLRTGPAEARGKTVLDAPLPPATRVFVSGTHPAAPQWWYVTAFLPDKVARGYVQNLRVTTDLPEPLAKLYQVKPGDTAEKLAAREFKTAVRDGHDLRYYENVLLHVNKQHGRAGVIGTYQDPGLLGGGANNVQLVAGHRIWLVSPAYARALEGVVPDGSLTNGAYAKVKRFVQHVLDLIASVTGAPQLFGDIAGDYAQAIRDHLPEIIGIVAGFIAAEAASMFLAATPTGVGQAAAAVIQLALAAFGAAGLVDAGIQALQHAGRWLTLAWTAHGQDAQIAEASREFLRMLVSLAMAALAYAGVKGNYGKALKIARSMPPTGLAPALATAGGPGARAATAGTGVKLGVPGPAGAVGTAGMMMEGKEGGANSNQAREIASTSKTTTGIQLPSSLTGQLRNVIENVIERAKQGKLKKTGHYHPHFDDGMVLRILSEPDAIYESQGKSGRLIFRKGNDIVVVEGRASAQGGVVTGYGPSGIKGGSGAAALGGSAGDAGAPITHAMIVDGKIPVLPKRPPLAKADQVAP